MNYKEMTKEDIDKVKGEIRHYYNARALFLGIGWGSIVLGVACYIFSFYQFFDKEYETYRIYAYSFMSIFILGGITMFILRGALYNRPISERKELIREAERYQKDQE